MAGLKALDEVKKPESLTDDAFRYPEKADSNLFQRNGRAGRDDPKDYHAAVQYYKAVLALNPDDAITSYRLGLAYMAMTPPQQMNAFWAIARAVTAKGATQAQSAKVKDYLRKLIVNYQQAACDNLTDAELNELLQLASSSPDRPDSYKLPSADDLYGSPQGHDHEVGHRRSESRRRQGQSNLVGGLRTGISGSAWQSDRSNSG